jgi:hypothetical protein
MPTFKTSYIRHLIGEIGERCAAEYLRDKGFWAEPTHLKTTEPVSNDGDLTVAKKVSQEHTFTRFEALHKKIEVKAAYGKFPRLSNVLSDSQKKRKEETLFILVKLRFISFLDGQFDYEIREVPEGWTDEWGKNEPKGLVLFKVESEKLICPFCGARMRKGKGFHGSNAS